MTERHQIRVNVPDAMFKKLEGDAQASGFSLPAYVQHLLLLQCDDRANWLAYTAATFSITVAQLLAAHVEHDLKKAGEMDKCLHKVGMMTRSLLGDAPRAPDRLFASEATWDDESFMLELQRVVRRFSSTGDTVKRADRRKPCPVCDRPLPWG